MPPEQKLNNEIINDFVTWVEMGAPHPDASKTKVEPRSDAVDWKQERKFWSFQPIKDPPIPATENRNWAAQSLDHFILAKHEEKGLTAAPQADKMTLIRRVTFALTGLPPTPEEVDIFLTD